MADQEQVERMRAGVQKWNEWRRVHSSKIIDLSGADLNEADLIRAVLDGANLSGANLSYADLIGAGSYQIALPDLAADTHLLFEWHHTTFVTYLRLCCRWGGFPGLERARRASVRDLIVLTRDLSPL